MQRNLTIEDRFWAKVEKSDACWLWTAARDPKGYGHFKSDVKGYAHRYAYELLVGPIPNGLQIDHLCRNPSCVRPDHLEAVTQRENMLRGEGFTAVRARQTECFRGHPFDEANTYRQPSRPFCRQCRQCNRERRRASKLPFTKEGGRV